MANNVVVWLYASDGTTYFDVTSYVTAFSCSRGKSRALDYYEPGTCNITFNNYSRVFDPTNGNTNLISNNNFETDTSGWSPYTAIYATSVYRGTYDATYRPFQPFSGTAYLMVVSATGVPIGSEFIATNTAFSSTVTAGQTYTLSAYNRTYWNTTVKVAINWYSASGFMYQSTSTYVPSSNTSWKRITNTAVAPPGAIKAEAVLFTVNYGGGYEDSYWDNIVLEQGSSAGSPLYGYVKPKQRVYATINGNSIFSGWIDDWSFTYDVTGEASASLVASELSTLFANQFFLKDRTFPAELSGARISRVLNLDEVAWPGGSTIDAGTQMLDKAAVVLGTNVLDYLRQVEVSEQGQLYVEGQDNLYFDDNSVGASTVGGFPTFADDGSGYYYEALDVSYTTQLLYNNIQVNAWDGIANRVAITPTSSKLFSPISLSVDGVLYTNGDKLQNLASYISSKYSEPEYRFNSITVNMFALDLGQQSVLRSRTPLNGFAQVIFTPNGVGSAITRYVRIIGITHDVTAGSHLVTFNLESLKTPNLVIDDNEFGKLDNYALGL
jgi:hypothetical protein